MQGDMTNIEQLNRLRVIIHRLIGLNFVIEIEYISQILNTDHKKG